MIKTTRNRDRLPKGQALVEFALVLTVLSMIVFGTIAFGRLWMTMNALTSAAREGVRVAAVTDPDPAQVQTAVQNVLNAANITGVTVTTTGPNGNNEVMVTVQMNYTVLTGSIVPGLSGTIPITRSSIMRWEG
jgi:Flp pilus assembly protein TadG